MSEQLERWTIDPRLAVLLSEYSALKDEQRARIGFRDNLLFVQMLSIGAIGAFGLSTAGQGTVFLLTPWITLILGWTYMVNDEKITSIGDYVSGELATHIRAITPQLPLLLFSWEHFHRSDSIRKERKLFQFLIDVMCFPLAGISGVILHLLKGGGNGTLERLLAASGVSAMLMLTVLLVYYSSTEKHA